MFKKLLALMLAIIIFSSSLFVLSACGADTGDSNENESDVGNEEANGNGSDNAEGIKVPQYKDYQRGTVDFDELIYERPDISALITLFEDIAKTVEKNEISFEEQINKIVEAEAPYTNMLSMSTLAHIYHSKDSSNDYWFDEYEYVSTNHPAFAQAIEKFFVAAAQSPNKERFENEYFKSSLDDYVNGGAYTDACVLLMEKEAEIEAKYTAISTDNVIISYEGKTDTYANIVSEYKEKYGESSQKYFAAKIQCDTLLEEEISKLESELFIELLKVRAKIADELGYNSYEKYAYETIYHDYSPEKLDTFINEVVNYVIPVYISLSNNVFTPFINEYENTTNIREKTDAAKLMNSLYDVYLEVDSDIADAYAYMLQHKLFDIAESTTNRFDASFTTYIDSNNSPFLFLTLKNNEMDMMTAAHEFGHFYDMYASYNATASLDFSEVSSQALELLTLSKIEHLYQNDKSTYKYVYYSELDSIFSTIIFQSFYAACEIAIYELDLDEINKENIDAAVAKTAQRFSLSSSINDVKYITIPHTMLYPFYVQSYATSITAAAQIYCMEVSERNSGFTVYKSLIDSKEDLDFEEALVAAGLKSPFAEGTLKEMSDDIYYIILGAHYFTNSNGNIA